MKSHKQKDPGQRRGPGHTFGPDCSQAQDRESSSFPTERHLKCRPAEELLPIYDGPDTLFFLDPPYVGTGKLDAYANFTPEQIAALAKQLRTLKGRFILTIDNRPEHRELFADYTQLAVETRSLMRPGSFGELIVHNL